MIRVLLYGDSPAMFTALRGALDARPELEIVGAAGDTDTAIDLAAVLEPDVVVLDPEVAGEEDCAAATRRIRDLLPSVRVVAADAPPWEFERAMAGLSDPFLRLAHGLARAVSARGVAALVARELAELTGGVAAVFFAEPGAGLSPAATAGASFVSAPGVALRSFRTGGLARASSSELLGLRAAGLGCEDALAAPLVHDGQALGAVLAAIPAGLRLRVDEELVSAVADLAASAAVAERRRALTHDEARRDALTGLPNRRAFEERLAAAVGGGRRTGLALIDLDDFKNVNDGRGHPAGDEALRQVARVAQRELRASDEVYRMGGDELAIVGDGDAADVARLADRVRKGLLRHRRDGALPTISVGVAAFPADAATGDDLVRRADVALYAAKRAGKNRVVSYDPRQDGDGAAGGIPAPVVVREGGSDGAEPSRRLPRVLVVDDDDHLRELLRTTLEFLEIEVDEAATGAAAWTKAALSTPDVIVLDLGLPDFDGLSLCRQIKQEPAFAGTSVIVLTGADAGLEAQAAGADSFLRKPFSPLELLSIVERFTGEAERAPVRAAGPDTRGDQLTIFADDLRRLLEIELGQRTLLQEAYRETVAALAVALESKDAGTGAHSQRVLRYAAELAWTLEPSLLDDPSVEYGFLLHDVGKIGIPDTILGKPGRLSPAETRLVRNHTILGEQMLGSVALLKGEGIRIVRSHHERWDGRGYPDGLAGTDIPLGARIFAVADALDAMTSDRPYRAARSWEDAAAEIADEAAHQFDPDVVGAFRESEPRLRRIYYELVTAI